MRWVLVPRDIAARRWKTLSQGEGWSRPLGSPAESASWLTNGVNTSGKSSSAMQPMRESCNYGTVLYMNYEGRVNQSFQRRIGYLKMNKVQGRLRVVPESTPDELVERLEKPKSPKFVVTDSPQVAPCDYPQVKELMDRPPKKCPTWIGREEKSQPMDGGAMKLRYIYDMKVHVVGYKACCQGYATGKAGSYYAVWEEGTTQTSSNL